MYLQVEVVNEESGVVSEVLTEGSSFGLNSILYEIPMECSARAMTQVDIFTFSREDFKTVYEEHPEVAGRIAEEATNEFGVKPNFWKL